jgi:hypothetical protein
MALNSRRPIAMAAALLVTLAPAVSCRTGDGSCGFFCQVAGPVGHPPPARQSTPTQPAGVANERRLGCGTYCQNAGGINGTLASGRDAVTIVSTGTVAADADKYLPVTLTCNLSVQCRGSLVLQFYFGPPDPSTGEHLLARSDLLVSAGATATLGVELPGVVLPYVPAHQPTCGTDADTGLNNCPNRILLIADAGPSLGCNGNASMPGADTAVKLPYCRGAVDGFRPVTIGGVSVVSAG